MLRNTSKIVVILSVALGLSGCAQDGNNGRPLLNLRQSAIAPDEFLVVPQKPLETPSNLSSLPVPDPGAESRAAIDFERNLMRALGGRTSGASGIPASDVAIVNAARSSFGATDNIRALVRAEDQAFREARSGRIERLAKKRLAATIYDPMLLDPKAELARLKALGVKTPAVLPQ